MQLPEFEPGCRFFEGPAVFYCEKMGASFYRPRVVFVPPRQLPGALVLCAEQAEFRRMKSLFIFGFEQFNDIGKLMASVAELVKDYEIRKVLARLTRSERDYINFFNNNRNYRDYISVMSPPKTNHSSGSILYHVSLTLELLRPGKERVLFPKGSPILRMLQSIPVPIENPTDIEHPGCAAVVYAIASMYHWETTESQQASEFRKKKYDPFGPNSTLDNYDPLESDDKYMPH